jgi:hypothetical protein
MEDGADLIKKLLPARIKCHIRRVWNLGGGWEVDSHTLHQKQKPKSILTPVYNYKIGPNIDFSMLSGQKRKEKIPPGSGINNFR